MQPKTFSRGTSLKDAWRACGVTVAAPLNPPWAARAEDDVIVLSLWRDMPYAGSDIRWTGRNAATVRIRGLTEEISPARQAKLRLFNELLVAALREPVRVLVLNWRRDETGRFVEDQHGAAVPVEVFEGTASAVDDPRYLEVKAVEP